MTDHLEHLVELERLAKPQQCMVRQLLCRTLSGNRCDLLTITSFIREDLEDYPILDRVRRPFLSVSRWYMCCAAEDCTTIYFLNLNLVSFCLVFSFLTSRLIGMPWKDYIFLSARVHPGESNASWIMKGILDFLTSDAVEAVELRRR